MVIDGIALYDLGGICAALIIVIYPAVADRRYNIWNE